MPALAGLLLLAAHAVPAPHAPSARELGPLLLGQYETALIQRMGKPTREDKEEDGDRILVYSLAGEMDTFMVFTVRGEEHPVVAAIQLTGQPLAGTRGLGTTNLGDDKATVLKAFGPPDKLEKDEDGEEFAQYEDRNYSFLFQNDKLHSIKIGSWDGGFPEKSGAPDLAGFGQALAARDQAKILDWLCADFEIYTAADGTVTLKSGAREEIADVTSLASRYLYGEAGSLRDALKPALLKTKPGERDGWPDGARPIHVFPKGSAIEEIVWKWEAGRWRIWEIDLKPGE